MGERRAYVITVDGYEPFRRLASSAAEARYKAWLSWHDAGLPGTFGDFIKRTSTLHLGPTSEAMKLGRDLVNAVLGDDDA